MTEQADTSADTAAVVDAPAVDANTDAAGDAASVAGDGLEAGATDDSAAASGDAATTEVAPYEGLVAPDGFEGLDVEALTAATPVLRSLGIETTEQAQETIGKFAPIIQGITDRTTAAVLAAQETARVDITTKWANELRADPVLGGGNYDRALAENGAALEKFGSPALREFLDTTGLGNHPDFARFVNVLAKATADDTIHLGDTTAQPNLTTAQKLYDKAFQPPT
jgi:hypothetical protein